MRKTSLAAAAVTGTLVLAPVAAFAAWTSSGSGTGTATATTVNRATAPSATRGTGSVALSWDAVTLANSTPVAGYDVYRHDGSTLTKVCDYVTVRSCTDTAPVAGSVTYGVVARVGENWQGPESVTTPFTYDVFAPTTTISTAPTAPNAAGWFNQNITVTLTAADSHSPATGVKEIRYSIDGGTVQVVAASTATFTISSEAEHQLTYWAVDNLVNTEAAHSTTVRLDKTAPTSSISPAAGSTTPLTATITAADNLSKVASITYAVDGGTPVTVAPSSTGTATVPVASGVHTVTWYATDVAGRQSGQQTVSYGVAQPTLAAPVVSCGTPGKKLVSFSWPAVQGATSYDLYYPDGSTLSTNQTSTTFKFDGVANVVGDFSVMARNGSSLSPMSNVKHYDTGTGSTAGTCTPSTP